MGQGSYTALIWGVAGDYPCIYDEDGDPQKWADDVLYGEDRSIKQSYESRKPWIGAFVAVSDYCLSEYLGKIPILEYNAYSFEEIQIEFKDQIEKAKEKWDRFQQIAKDNGVDMPDGKLLLVFDYD